MTATGAPAPAAIDWPAHTIAYLGPVGTFTEQAVLTQPDLAAGELIPYPSMSDVLYAVADGTVDLGVVAVENAIEGTVNVTVDHLAFDVDLFIQRELVLGVQMNLMAPPGTTLDAIKTVMTIPVAWAQCRAWLREHLPGVELLATGSTAEAAETVSATTDGSVAAIANQRAAEVYGLDVLAADIEDHPENQTRFVLVGREGVPAPTGHDKTSIVVFQRADAPGSLLSILQEFAARRINLSLLLSRPTKSRLGDYCFVLDLDGHVADEVVADCLRSLRAKQADVKFLGSYPAAGDHGHEVRPRSMRPSARPPRGSTGCGAGSYRADAPRTASHSDGLGRPGAIGSGSQLARRSADPVDGPVESPMSRAQAAQRACRRTAARSASTPLGGQPHTVRGRPSVVATRRSSW